MRSLITFICTAIASTTLLSQEINNYSSLFDVQDSSFVRLSYDNDLFRFTDRFYSQGIEISVFSLALRKNPINKLLFQLNNSERDRFGIEFRTHGCTPSTILSDSVLFGDRPYASTFSIGFVRASQQLERQMRLTSQMEIGIIGPAALGKQTQTFIHRLTGDDLPLGWQHQIKNAPILNYTLRLEKYSAYPLPGVMISSLFGQAKIGTFQTNVSGGFEFSIGQRNSPLLLKRHRYQFFVYSQSSFTVVGYDASLMGGIINRDGYHLKYSEINPLVLRQHIGLVLSIPHFSFTFDFGFVAPEIKDGPTHSWGGVRLAFH